MAMENMGTSHEMTLDGSSISGIEDLKEAWESLTEEERKRFKHTYGEMGELVNVKIDMGLIFAAKKIYEPKLKAFVFKKANSVLAPTLEEYAVLLGLHERSDTLPYLDLTTVAGDPMDELAEIVGQNKEQFKRFFRVLRGGNQGLLWSDLKKLYLPKGKASILVEHHKLALIALGYFALILFPVGQGIADDHVISYFNQRATHKQNRNFVSAALAETYRTLDFLSGASKGTLRASAQLLYVWLRTHLPTPKGMEVEDEPGKARKVFNNSWFIRETIKEYNAREWPAFSFKTWTKSFDALKENDIIFKPKWVGTRNYVWRCTDDWWVPVFGVRGSLTYAPGLAFRQFGDVFTPLDLFGPGSTSVHYSARTFATRTQLAQFTALWDTRVQKEMREPFRITLRDERYTDWIKNLLNQADSLPPIPKEIMPKAPNVIAQKTNATGSVNRKGKAPVQEEREPEALKRQRVHEPEITSELNEQMIFLSEMVQRKDKELLDQKFKVHLAGQTVKELQTKLAKNEEEYESLAQQNKDLEERLSYMAIKEEKMKKTVGRYQLKREEAEKSRDAAVDRWMAEKQVMQGQIDTSEQRQEIESLNEVIEDLTRKLKKLEMQSTELSRDKEKLQKLSDDQEKVNKDLHAKGQKMRDKQQEMLFQRLRMENTLSSQEREMQKLNLQLSQAVRGKEEAIMELRKAEARFREELQLAFKEHNRQGANMEVNHQTEIQSLSRSNGQMRAEIEALRNEVHGLQRDRSEQQILTQYLVARDGARAEALQHQCNERIASLDECYVAYLRTPQEKREKRLIRRLADMKMEYVDLRIKVLRAWKWGERMFEKACSARMRLSNIYKRCMRGDDAYRELPIALDQLENFQFSGTENMEDPVFPWTIVPRYRHPHVLEEVEEVPPQQPSS